MFNVGSVDISWGNSRNNQPFGCTHRLADVGNRVHTRHDSDEDVRGNACKKAIAWKALPWSFHYVAHGYHRFYGFEPSGLCCLRFSLAILIHIR